MKTACFAGGCFWCITPPFEEAEGVSRVTCGYCGGSAETAHYGQVKAQGTGHRECVLVEYDPAVTSFEKLMRVFLANVDPFDGGGQFIDRGESYTLCVFCASAEEKETAARLLAELAAASGREPRVALAPAAPFYPAEEEHQDYYLKNPEAFENELIESGRKPAPGKERA